MMKDFYYSVKDALDLGGGWSTRLLFADYGADPNLTFEIRDKPIYISSKAFFEDKGGSQSLEFIYNIANAIHKEIPFGAIINPETDQILEFSIGSTKWLRGGSAGWAEGTFLERINQRAIGLSGKVSLGHTHPRGYGAVCSNMHWHEDLVGDLYHQYNGRDKAMYDIAWQNRMYEEYGGDYCEMFLRLNQPNIYNLFSIMSPRFYNGGICGQLGFFEIHPEGLVVYRPWIIN